MKEGFQGDGKCSVNLERWQGRKKGGRGRGQRQVGGQNAKNFQCSANEHWGERERGANQKLSAGEP